MMRALTTGLALVFCGVPLPAQGGIFDFGEAQIHYVAAGSGQAVVFIHGWALTHREWDDQMAALAPHFHVIAYDRRGYGRSTGFSDVSADPGDLRDLLDSLDVRRAVLVGHSAGGDVARRFADAFPERVAGLVLYPGGPRPPDFPLPPEMARPIDPAAFAREHGLDSLFRFVRSRPQFQARNPDRRPEIAALVDSMVSSYSGRDLLEDRPPSGRFPLPLVDAMRQWRFPVVFLLGEHESARAHLISDSLSRWMPNARKVVIPGGGHGVHFDEPERFNTALIEFLRSLEEPGSR